MFVRSSTVAGECDSTDTARDIRGFAVRFYTDDGRGIGSAAASRLSSSMTRSSSPTWFMPSSPAPGNAATLVTSDRRIPRSLRVIQGFRVHTFRRINSKGRSCFVRLQWLPGIGPHSMVWEGAVEISRADSNFHRRKLWDALEGSECPEWQLVAAALAEAHSNDVLDGHPAAPRGTGASDAGGPYGAKPQFGSSLSIPSAVALRSTRRVTSVSCGGTRTCRS